MSIALKWIDGGADVIAGQAGLITDNSLYSEIVICLFTDRLALVDDVIPDGTTDRRGVWSDSFSDQEPKGSRLWLLSREKLIQRTANRAREYIEEALAYLVTESRALKIDVRVSLMPPQFLAAYISITLPDGSIYEPFPNALQIEVNHAI